MQNDAGRLSSMAEQQGWKLLGQDSISDIGDLETREAVSGSSKANKRRFWNGIWNLRIPNKIESFCWQAYTESPPTLVNLHRRKVLSSPLCSNCGKADETTLHALWDYEKIHYNCVSGLISYATSTTDSVLCRTW